MWGHGRVQPPNPKARWTFPASERNGLHTYRDWEHHGLLQALLIANLVEDDSHFEAVGLVQDVADERCFARAQCTCVMHGC